MKKVDLFSLWTPINIQKSQGDGAEEPLKGPIAGIVSTEATDLQGDSIIQAGCDWDYFLRRGWLNYEHQQGPEYIVGYPTLVKPTVHKGQPATMIEGYLLLDRPRAKEVYESARAIQKAADGRSIGFSVEGQVMERDSKNPKIITKARILNVSVTAHPVNPDARLEVLARSLLELEPQTSIGESDNVSATLAETLKLEEVSMPTDTTEKGLVGYQEAAKPDPEAALSPVAPQSLDGQPSSKSAESEEDMAVLLEGMMRRVMKEEMAKMMSDEVEKMMDQAKGYYSKDKVSDAEKSADLRPPMVSLPQMQTLLGKVFPQLPASEQRAMARKLLSAAKSYHSN
jgi:hypothetical protein